MNIFSPKAQNPEAFLEIFPLTDSFHVGNITVKRAISELGINCD